MERCASGDRQLVEEKNAIHLHFVSRTISHAL
jgi:hypothetical protein